MLRGLWIPFVLWATFMVAVAQLPPEILADSYLVRAERLMADENYGAALNMLDKIIALQREHDLTLPEEFHFKYAQMALSAGSFQTALESVKKYLVRAGRDGEFYREALKLLDAAEEKFQQAEAEWRRAEAKRRRMEAQQREREEQVRQQVEAAAQALPRDTLRSGGLGPEMVKIASGRFQYRAYQGSGTSTHLWWVAVDRPFAVGKYEVTRGEFEKFVKSTRYRTEAEHDPKYGCQGVRTRYTKKNSKLRWNHPGFNQTDKHPVTCVSIRDAMAYARWLSQETGHSYRLPSPAEWQYAARAGSKEAMLYIKRTDPEVPGICSQANVDDCSNGVRYTAEVGRFASNGVGVHDMIGNVAEWVLACAHAYKEKGVSGDFLRLALHGLPENPDGCEKYVVGEGGGMVPRWRSGEIL